MITRYAFPFAISTIHHEPDGAAWVGTGGGGLLRIKNGVVKAITSKNGLYDDIAHTIVDDASTKRRRGQWRFPDGQ